MKLNFKPLKGPVFIIEGVDPSDKVQTLKKRVEELHPEYAPAERIKLIEAGKILDDNNTLEEQNVKENAFVVLTVSKKKKSDVPQPKVAIDIAPQSLPETLPASAASSSSALAPAPATGAVGATPQTAASVPAPTPVPAEPEQPPQAAAPTTTAPKAAQVLPEQPPQVAAPTITAPKAAQVLPEQPPEAAAPTITAPKAAQVLPEQPPEAAAPTITAPKAAQVLPEQPPQAAAPTITAPKAAQGLSEQPPQAAAPTTTAPKAVQVLSEQPPQAAAPTTTAPKAAQVLPEEQPPQAAASTSTAPKAAQAVPSAYGIEGRAAMWRGLQRCGRDGPEGREEPASAASALGPQAPPPPPEKALALSVPPQTSSLEAGLVEAKPAAAQQTSPLGNPPTTSSDLSRPVAPACSLEPTAVSPSRDGPAKASTAAPSAAPGNVYATRAKFVGDNRPAGFAPAARSGAQGLERLRSDPSFKELASVLADNPEIFEQVLATLAATHPSTAQEIREKKPEFLRMVQEAAGKQQSPVAVMLAVARSEVSAQESQKPAVPPPRPAARELPSPPVSVEEEQLPRPREPPAQEQGQARSTALASADDAAIDRLSGLGFDRELAKEVFLACGRNEELAASCLFEDMEIDRQGAYAADDNSMGYGNCAANYLCPEMAAEVPTAPLPAYAQVRWFCVEGARHHGDDMDPTGYLDIGMEAALRYAESQPACTGFTVDKHSAPPSYWFHTTIVMDDCFTGRHPGFDLYILRERFAASIGVIPQAQLLVQPVAQPLAQQVAQPLAQGAFGSLALPQQHPQAQVQHPLQQAAHPHGQPLGTRLIHAAADRLAGGHHAVQQPPAQPNGANAGPNVGVALPELHTLTEADEAAIQRLANLGFSYETAMEAYVLCDRSEEYAGSYLFSEIRDYA